MNIQRLKISNWRSIKQLDIEVSDLMVIIGQNNHGKSNLLSAVLFFFGELKHQDLDFHHWAPELYVEVTFGDLDDRDRITFQKYLTSDNKVVVRKTAQLNGSFEYRGYIENPEEEWLQESNANAYTKRETAASLPFGSFLPPSGRLSKQNIVEAQTAYIAQHRDDLVFTFEQETTNFLGLKNVAKGIFGDVYFIPAVKEASDDFLSKETSAFGKIYSAVIAEMSTEHEDWKETRSKLELLFGTLNKRDHEGNPNHNRPPQLTAFEDALSQELSSWGAGVDIEVLSPDIESLFKANTQVWIDDGVRTDIRRKGHGLQRALTVALIHVIASKVREQNNNEEDQTRARSSSNSRYYIFEEPELYLHPQAQRALFDSFVELSEADSQVFLCTHSSGLINVEKYRSIYIVSKENEEEGSRVKYCSEELFTGNAKKDFNLSYWINPDRSELFFASKVLLVEGATDKTVIPLLAKQLGVFRYDYTLIDCGAKDNIPYYVRLMNKFGIQHVVMYDRDHQEGKEADAIGAADRSTRFIEEELDASLGRSIVFENDIEEELGMQAGNKSKPYVALTHVIGDSFELSSGLEQKIRNAYDAAT
ncbi:MAG: AAA family ATPase [Desulfuromonadales bacterium]|nr:AAA family ATPase [Desulfuromonadales bacterium]